MADSTGKPMRVLLRHSQTGLYYLDPKQWTDRPEEAWDFKASVKALQLVTEMKIEGVEILLWFDDPRYNLTLPLNQFQRARGF
jgi:hypothetical protein